MSKTIFFVDDDRDFLDAQAAFFRARGFVVVTADHGEKARDLLQEASPNIIVLDLMMERADTGVTLSHAIRKMDHLRDVPVILLTGVVAATGKRLDRDVVALRKWARIDAYLDKPVTGRQLLRTVEEQLARVEGTPPAEVT
jgi:DNA-binding response OmpR family regulator